MNLGQGARKCGQDDHFLYLDHRIRIFGKQNLNCLKNMANSAFAPGEQMQNFPCFKNTFQSTVESRYLGTRILQSSKRLSESIINFDCFLQQ